MQRTKKLMNPPQVWWRDCVIFRNIPYRYLRYVGSPDEATLRDEAQCRTMHYCRPIRHSSLLTYYVLALCAALALTYLAPSAQLPGKKLHTTRAHSPTAWRTFKQLVNTTVPPFMLSGSEWKEKFLSPSTAHNATEAYEIMCRLDHTGKIDESLHGKKQKAATALLCDEIRKQDFAKTSCFTCLQNFGASQSLSHCTDSASRASRPGLTVGFLHILCSGLCTTQRFPVEGEEKTCRVGCPDEPHSLAHCNECPLFCNFFASVWEQATVLPRRGHLFHDLIILVFLRSLQYGIVVMGVIDAFVHGHNHHRRNMDNPGNFGDCMKGR